MVTGEDTGKAGAQGSGGDTGGHPGERVPCVGAVIRWNGRLLLVRRAWDPGAGTWSLPGGRVDPGETARGAVLREVLEETGLRVLVLGTVGTVCIPAGAGRTYVVEDFACEVVSGVARAGDDATEIGWFDAAAVAALPCSPSLVETLRSWGVLPG